MSSHSSPPFIVDSHVHFWAAEDLDRLAWCTPSHALARPCLAADYLAAVNSEGEQTGPRVGYIYVEADRKNGGDSGSDGSDWTEPLAEVAWLRRLIEEEAVGPEPRSGGAAGDAGDAGEAETAAPAVPSSQARCLAIVPWAPVHAGPEVLAQYLDRVRETAGPLVWPRVRGVRYLVQDKPAGTMLTDAFVGSLQLLGRRGLAFDLGIDQHRRGRAQLDEAVALVERVHAPDVADADKVVLVLNHLAKPDLSVLNPAADRGFAAWRDTMFALAKAPSPEHVYVKLSGLFSEMPAVLRAQSAEDIFAAAFPWLAVVLAAFGPGRLMFASDWPVCTAGFAPDPETETATKTTTRTLNAAEVGAWNKWRRVVARLCYMATLSEDDEANIWGGTAVKAYGLLSDRKTTE